MATVYLTIARVETKWYKLSPMTQNDLTTNYSVVPENLDSLNEYRNNSGLDLRWGSVFSLPEWMGVWWNVFGGDNEPLIFSVRNNDEITGIAPLKLVDKTASFIGSADICDYLDFVVSPEKAAIFSIGLLDYLAGMNLKYLDLRCLRPESAALKSLMPIARERGYAVTIEPDGLSLETRLPPTWDEYLMELKSKQRHEVKRKFRRFHEAGDTRFDVYEDDRGIRDRLDIFFKLFRESRKDKSEFMTPKMESFFNQMISAMLACRILRLGVMSLNEKPVAAVMYFDYNNSIYLYNNGYDTDYGPLSVGVLSKAMLIQRGIEEEKITFDFLKGPEVYKYRLGGKEVPLSRLRVVLN